MTKKKTAVKRKSPARNRARRVEPPPYEIAHYEAADISAIQALERGEATPEQQKRALTWIIIEAARTYDQSFRPDPYETAFAEGRRFVGNEVVKMLKLNASAMRRESNVPTEQP